MTKQARQRTEELRRLQAEKARREGRRQRVVWVIGGVLVLGLIVAIGVAVTMAARDSTGGSATGGEAPANVVDGAIPVGDEDAPVAVTLYFDYICPACGQFEQANGEQLDQMLTDGDIRMELRPIAFLDRASQGTRYSTRSANALATTADGAPEQVWSLHQALYASQPAEGTSGLSDQEIADIAEQAGVPAEVTQRFADLEYEGWVADVTEKAFDAGVTQTPTILIDGEEFTGDPFAPAELKQAIDSAAGGGAE